MIDRSAPLPAIFTALLLAVVPSYAHAQAEPAPQTMLEAPKEVAADAAPPATQVRAARLTFFAGAVRVQRSDNTGEDTAVLNMPLGEGTRVLAGDYGQAEIEFEDGSVARLTPRSALSINHLALDSAHIAHTELGLLGGLAYFELRKSAGYTWLIDAGGTRAVPLENLALRLNLDEPPAVFAVLTGAAHIERPGAFEADVTANESLRSDSRDETRYFLTPQLPQESWDAWNESRDQAAADAADKRTAARDAYAGDQGYGWSDLDASGNWYNVPGTGPNSSPVWQPDNADEGFDPYGYGAWVWGNGAYVWASGYTWGWTPFRCGHWQYFSGFGWGWQPDNLCSGWSFAGGGAAGGGGVFIRGGYPPRHNPVVRPQPRPGDPHPILPVHGPDGPRPWTPHTGPVKIGGISAVPLPHVANSSTRSGSMVGKTLTSDFPVDRKTHEPILGAEPNATTYVNAPPSTPRLAPGLRTPKPAGATIAAPAVGSSTGTRNTPGPTTTIPRPSPAAPSYVPAAQAPARSAPPPPPAPTRSAPPPAPPQSAAPKPKP